MTPFELLEPTSLREALGLLDADDPAVRPVGGGTALMLMMKAGVFHPTRLISLRKAMARSSRTNFSGRGTAHVKCRGHFMRLPILYVSHLATLL